MEEETKIDIECMDGDIDSLIITKFDNGNFKITDENKENTIYIYASSLKAVLKALKWQQNNKSKN